jgi:hypothetical protein
MSLRGRFIKLVTATYLACPSPQRAFEWETTMKVGRKLWIGLSVSGALISIVAVAQTTTPGVMTLTPSEMRWSPQGTVWNKADRFPQF